MVCCIGRGRVLCCGKGGSGTDRDVVPRGKRKDGHEEEKQDIVSPHEWLHYILLMLTVGQTVVGATVRHSLGSVRDKMLCDCDCSEGRVL